MSIHGLKILSVVVLLCALATGCQSVPPAPGHVTAQNNNDGEGWLFDRLMGRDSAGSAQKSPSSDVQQASAETPADAPQNVVSPIPTSVPEIPKPEDQGIQPEDFELDNIWKNMKNAAGYGPDEKLAQQSYKEGQTLFQQKEYKKAVDKFKSAAGRWPDSILEEDALFMQAESEFFDDRYSAAFDTYGNLLKKYQNSRHLDKIATRQFSIGQYWEQIHRSNPHWPVTPNFTDKTLPWFDTFGNATKAYESVRLNDPTGPLADDSVMSEANAYFLRGRYYEAADAYELLRNEYPKSEHQVKAHLLEMKARQKTYQGSEYDGKPISAAGDIAEKVLTQFPRQLGDEHGHVVKLRNRIENEKAHRDWSIAQFYDKKEQYGAARYYYGVILKDFPRSKAADMAKARLDEIKDLPDNPPNRFEWLTNAFSHLK